MGRVAVSFVSLCVALFRGLLETYRDSAMSLGMAHAMWISGSSWGMRQLEGKGRRTDASSGFSFFQCELKPTHLTTPSTTTW